MLNPNADPAERSVVGAALLKAESIRSAVEYCTPADFADVRLGALYSLLIGMRGAGHPIDTITVANRLTEEDNPLLRGVTPLDLINIQAETPTASNVSYYAKIVASNGLKRRFASFGLRAHQLASAEDMSAAEVANLIRDEYQAVRGELAGGIATKTLTEILEGSDEYHWLIPGLLERGDRLVLTGGEGAGKTTFVRQLAICAAAGIHPLTFRPIDPIRVLVVDAENTEQQWRRKVRPLVLKAKLRSNHNPADTIHIANTARLDITTDKALGDIHKAVDDHQPDMLLIGPLYKLVPRAITNDDDAAPLITALDTLRDRGLTLVMEAHAGHAKMAGGERDLRPRGSSALLGWPEFGFGLGNDPHDPNLTHLVRWRGDRDERDWPDQLRRGGDWPWTDGRQPTTRPDSPYYGEPR